MERKKRKNRSTYIIFILLVVITLLYGLWAVNSYLSYKKAVSVNKANDQQSNKEEKKSTELQTKYQEITTEIAYMNNLDKLIADEKTDYFKGVKELENKILSGQSNSKIAYLTFDDGPYYLTYKYLEVLERYDVIATFFVIGSDKSHCYDKHDYDCTKIYQEIVKKGHVLGNHTYSHNIHGGLYSSTNSFIYQLTKMESYLYDKTSFKTNIVRMPGGSGTASMYGIKSTIISKLREKGYGWIDWTASDGDGSYLPSKEKAWSNFVGSINSKIEVVLLHDYSGITLSVLPNMIEYLKNNGYQILPLFYESAMVNK